VSRKGLAVGGSATLIWILRLDRNAVADVAEQLLENTEFASARRGRVCIVRDEAPAFDAVILNSGNGVAIEAHDHHAAVGDVWRVKRHLRLNFADIIPSVLFENGGRRGGAKARANSVARIDA